MEKDFSGSNAAQRSARCFSTPARGYVTQLALWPCGQVNGCRRYWLPTGRLLLFDPLSCQLLVPGSADTPFTFPTIEEVHREVPILVVNLGKPIRAANELEPALWL